MSVVVLLARLLQWDVYCSQYDTKLRLLWHHLYIDDACLLQWPLQRLEQRSHQLWGRLCRRLDLPERHLLGVSVCFVCSSTNLAGWSLITQSITTDIFCRYEVVPNDFFCRYFLYTGLQKQDHDDGECPPVADISTNC